MTDIMQIIYGHCPTFDNRHYALTHCRLNIDLNRSDLVASPHQKIPTMRYSYC